MQEITRRKHRITILIYWLMLAYILAALTWWYISLMQQNNRIHQQQRQNIELLKNSLSPGAYTESRALVDSELQRNRNKYIAEGITFLILLVVGAAFVYRSVRRQFNVQMQQHNFVMAVTHELKTPIAVVKLNLETLQRYHLDPEKQQRLIRTTLDETTRLNNLTSNILVSSQLERVGYVSAIEELDLGDLLKDCIRDFRARFPDRVFNEMIETDADLKGDALLLQIMINNLLENAVKYSPRESPITAVLVKKTRELQLEVIDEGPGIPEPERKKIFEKFYRIGNEETRRAQGTGLGLYLCRRIAGEHNADILVTNQNARGSKFVVRFKI